VARRNTRYDAPQSEVDAVLQNIEALIRIHVPARTRCATQRWAATKLAPSSDGEVSRPK